MSTDKTAQRTILRKARKSLLIAAVASLLGLGVWLGSGYAAQYFRQQTQAIVAQMGAQQGEFAVLHDDLANIEAHLDDYQRLQRQGLIGVPRREEWVEQLLASHAALGLPGTLGYALKPAQALQGDPSAENPTEVGLSAPGSALRHDLELTLDGVHEGDILRLLERLESEPAGRFRLQSCEFLSPGKEGFNARCVLRYFTLPLPAQAPAGEA